MAHFRSSKFIEKYEFLKFDLETPLVLPGNTQNQKLTNYTFVVDNTNSIQPMDFYNGYIELSFRVEKRADGTAFVAADRVSTINSAYSLIKQMHVNINGVHVNDADNMNLALNIKNLLEISNPHLNMLTNAFYHFDKNTSTVVAFADFNALKAGKYITDSGFIQRHDLITGLKINNVILSLNRYGFFSSLEDELCPNLKISININLEESDNIIFSHGGSDVGRIVIIKMILWVPKITFNSQGEKLYLERYLKPHTWRYLKEQLGFSTTTQSSQGSYMISSAIERPRHVFIWACRNKKLSDQNQNMFHFDTFDLGAGEKLISSQLEVGQGLFIPSQAINPDAEISSVYRSLMQYNKSYNDVLTGSQLNLELFKSMYGILYFDLRNQPEIIRNGLTRLIFKWRLSINTTDAFSWYSLVLQEEEISVAIVSGKVVLK